MTVAELQQELAGLDPTLEVFLPVHDPLGEPLPAHEWEYVYEAEDYEGNGKPRGILIEVHEWGRYGR